MVLLMWVLGCSTKPDVETCPEGQAMDAAGICQDVADGGTPDDGASDDGASDDDPSDDGEVDDSGTSLVPSTDGVERLQSVFPQAVGQILAPIPSSLNTENDIEHGNDELGRVVDSSGDTLGFARHIFTPVYCVAGVCEAIQFVMTFSADHQPHAVYHLSLIHI